MKHTEKLCFVEDHKGEPSHLPFSFYPEGDPLTEVARCAPGYPKLFAAAPEMAAMLREIADGDGDLNADYLEGIEALLAELEEHE